MAISLLLSALALAPELEWNDLTFTVKGRPILDGVSGRARGGRMLAIMGPSGSGKTSVLNALAAVSYTHLTLPTIYSV